METKPFTLLFMLFIAVFSPFMVGCDTYDTASRNSKALQEESYLSAERRLREAERIRQEEAFRTSTTIRSEQAAALLLGRLYDSFSDKRVKVEPYYTHHIEYISSTEGYSVADVTCKWTMAIKGDNEVEISGKLYTYPDKRAAVFKCTHMCKPSSKYLKRATKKELEGDLVISL